MLLPLKMAKRRLNTEKKLFWNGVTDVLHPTNEVTSSPPQYGAWLSCVHCRQTRKAGTDAQ